MIMVTVSNMGTGILQDDMDNIFNPFQTGWNKGVIAEWNPIFPFLSW